MSRRLAAICGSIRRGSYNRAVLVPAIDAARAAGAEVTDIDLRDYPLPLYDGDLEDAEGIPAKARELRDLLMDHQGLLIASPEYNTSITPLLKNTIDWISRPDGDLPRVAVFQQKVAGLLAASPGGGGGRRALTHLRGLLQNIGVMVIPESYTVSGVHAYVKDGRLTDDAQIERAGQVGSCLAKTLGKLTDG